MATIFSRIVAGEIPAYKIAEDERFFSFLDINPLVKGHTLVIPKQETDYLFDLDDNTLADMMVFAKRVAKALKSVVPCKRIGIAVLGLEVPHAHIHLVPLNSEGDINFSKSRVKLSKEEFAQLAERIAKDMV
ncbi:MAG: HIT family protein [Tenuifilaceae bacterium]|jgi:histidine triad (HIT) family protein|nr:HIT family protein [Bacteroidales bacterium]MDI9517525.1 HIT family protein [Bacteroidota bacterium]NLH56340.1 HIT family protein [Rikenellaceae bacterium]OQC64513.1 MAG: HIT-like protein [Bacteroidetes bacterium ADurb.Bin008]HOF90872.1 HIT family protein [Tenuifilaceae bacterium]